VLYVYLFAAVVGGVLLAASVALGGHHGADGGDAAGADHGHDPGPGGALGATLLSVRFWTYLLAFGGGTGLVLRLAVGTGGALTALLAAGAGVGSGVLAQAVVGRATAAVGGTVRDDELVGKAGRLLLPAGKQTPGRVRVTVRNQVMDLVAYSVDDGDLQAREDVLVVEVVDGTARVARSPLKELKG
jgi:hypothetical protein